MPKENNNKDKILIHERLTKVETLVESILKNHLPHLQRTMDKLNKKFWAIIMLLFANLIGFLFYLIQQITK